MVSLGTYLLLLFVFATDLRLLDLEEPRTAAGDSARFRIKRDSRNSTFGGPRAMLDRDSRSGLRKFSGLPALTRLSRGLWKIYC